MGGYINYCYDKWKMKAQLEDEGKIQGKEDLLSPSVVFVPIAEI